jgi:hypothetical protein
MSQAFELQRPCRWGDTAFTAFTTFWPAISRT